MNNPCRSFETSQRLFSTPFLAVRAFASDGISTCALALLGKPAAVVMDFVARSGDRPQRVPAPRLNKWSHRGMSLLEVILALAILGLSLAAIGELMRIGLRNAESARDQTTAQILCETKMAELVTGMVPAQATSAAPILDVGDGNEWLYQIETQQVDQQGLLAVRVVVQQNPEVFSRPASFALVRWIIDPNSQSMGSTATGSSS